MKANKASSNTAPMVGTQQDAAAIGFRPRFLRLPEVKAMTALSKASIYKRMATRQFPQSIRLGSRFTVWLEDELIEWINLRTEDARSERLQLPNVIY